MMGARLRELPQHPSREPQARLEGRRRARHPGDRRSRSRSPPTSSRSNICWSISRSGRDRGCRFIALQRRQAATIRGMNRELETANEFLAALSMKISRYLSPQIYKSIFSGQKDVTIHTERKKLTIFFSDIKDFTATTERLQPEQITQLLNEYFTEMSTIALSARRHHRQVHRRRDADLLRRPGDQGRSRGRAGLPAHGARDAAPPGRAQCQMAQRRASSSRSAPAWASIPATATSAISAARDRMDYTIIGAEANLAARLQSIAEPGHIVSATKPMRWCATCWSRTRCRRSP